MKAKKLMALAAAVLTVGTMAVPASAEVVLKYSETNAADSTDG